MADEPQLQHIKVSEIYRGRRFRESYDNMEDFVESIKDKGVFTPITVRPYEHPDYCWELMAGGRRMYGCELAKIDTIPALIRDIGDEDLDLREVELFENVFREELAWTEKIALVDEIMRLWTAKHKDEPWKWSQRKCAKMLGVSKSQLSRDINLARAIEVLPELADCKTEDDARKKLKRMQEQAVVDQEIKKHKAVLATTTEDIHEDDVPDGYTKEHLALMRRADANYHIGDVFEGLEKWVGVTESGKGMCRFIECDPPYAIELQSAKRRTGEDDIDLDEYNEVDRDEYSRFLNRLTGLLYRVLQPDSWCIFWFGPSWFTDTKIALIRAGFDVDPIPGIWTKGTGQTNAPDLYLARCYEPFFIARKGKPRILKPGRSNVFEFKPVSPAAKYHPTQRPIELMDELYACFGCPNATVLVPFLGSGVSLRAAYRSHMHGVGWDLSKEYKKRFILSVVEDSKLMQGQLEV